MKILKRWQEKTLINALKTSRVVLLAGSRQCGKTTLAKNIPLKNYDYKTLDDFSQRQFANLDPDGFLKTEKHTLIIDEIQKSPILISSIKKIADENNKNSQFLTTGSSNIQSNPSTKESLAGRVEKIRLRSFCFGEIEQSEPNFLKNAFNKKFKLNKKNYTRDDIIQICLNGGYPMTFNKTFKEKKIWFENINL